MVLEVFARLHAMKSCSLLQKIVTEASTDYLYSRAAVPGILNYSERPRFIATVRNPVDMAPSLHSHLVFNVEEDIKEFEHAWSIHGLRATATRFRNNEWTRKS